VSARFTGRSAATLAAADRSADSGAAPDAGLGDLLNDAVRQVRDAAAPLMRQLTPAIRDAIQRIGQTAEE
jgi:hypothetical protein